MAKRTTDNGESENRRRGRAVPYHGKGEHRDIKTTGGFDDLPPGGPNTPPRTPKFPPLRVRRGRGR